MKSLKARGFLILFLTTVVSSSSLAGTIYWFGHGKHRTSTYPPFNETHHNYWDDHSTWPPESEGSTLPDPSEPQTLTCQLAIDSQVETCPADSTLNVGDSCFCYKADGSVDFSGSVFAL